MWDFFCLMQADDNGDRKLTLKEMLDHESVFYSTVHVDGHQESDDEHDELWCMNQVTRKFYLFQIAI